jgi:hypothetical protein
MSLPRANDVRDLSSVRLASGLPIFPTLREQRGERVKGAAGPLFVSQQVNSSHASAGWNSRGDGLNNR